MLAESKNTSSVSKTIVRHPYFWPFLTQSLIPKLILTVMGCVARDRAVPGFALRQLISGALMQGSIRARLPWPEIGMVSQKLGILEGFS